MALRGLEVFARAGRRLVGEAPDLTAGSAARFVDEVCARIAGGQLDGIAASFDLAILDSLPEERRTAATLRAVLGWAKGGHGRRALGWWVEPTWEERGSLAWVTVRVPFEEAAPEARAALVRRALADPAGPAALDDETRSVLDGVPAAERDALLGRMAGAHTRGVMDLRFVVRRRGDRHQVVDVHVDGVGAREHLATWLRLSEATAVAETPRARAGSSGIALLLLLAIVPAVILAAAILGARNRRRRHHHAALSARRGSG
jgi:hypothetical protein